MIKVNSRRNICDWLNLSFFQLLLQMTHQRRSSMTELSVHSTITHRPDLSPQSVCDGYYNMLVLSFQKKNCWWFTEPVSRKRSETFFSNKMQISMWQRQWRRRYLWKSVLFMWHHVSFPLNGITICSISRHTSLSNIQYFHVSSALQTFESILWSKYINKESREDFRHVPWHLGI